MFFYCPHQEDEIVLNYRKRCQNRKPAAGMILNAAKKHDISLINSILVGNNYSDIAAGMRAGITHLSLLDVNIQESKDYHTARDLVTIKEWYFC